MYYKLLKQDMTSHGGCKWEIGKKKTTSGEDDLCGPGWLHCYNDPLLAVLLNPIHADIKNPQLFECNCEGLQKEDNGLKYGFTEMTLTKEIPMPEITTEQCIRFAVLCAKEVYKDKSWDKWAENWLSGKDRTVNSAYAAARAATGAATYAATYAAARAAANAAYAVAANAAAGAADSAYAAARAATEAAAYAATYAAARAATEAAAYAAATYAAAGAAANAAYAATMASGKPLNLIELAKKACTV